jgi:hypothetical protein
LDTFVETVLIQEYNRGKRRARNRAYLELANELAKVRRRGDRTQARVLRKTMRALPSTDPNDPGYRRLRYCRYADDTLLGFTGPKAEAEEIKQRLAQFLHDDLKLELSQDKTLITHARTSAARFLGYEITVQHNNRQCTRGQRYVNGNVALRVPRSVIKAKSAPYLLRGKLTRRTQIINRDDYHIVATYGAEYRGIVQYYLLAGDVFRLHRLRWVMQTSLLKTLASKHRSTVTKMAAKHRAKITTPRGPRTCYEAVVERVSRKTLVARFGGIPLARQKASVIEDHTPTGLPQPRKELVTRLLKGRCELCEQTGQMQVHQVRKLADLDLTGPVQPSWAALMTRRSRKTLVVCTNCHEHIHTGQPTTNFTA